MTFVIATANMKGGVGKTTLTVNLATCLAKNHHKRVLIVDLDTQVSATLSLMAPAEFAKLRSEKRTLRQLVHQAILADKQLPHRVPEAIRAYMCNIKGLDLLPGDIDLYDEYLVSQMLHRRSLQQEQMDFEAIWNSFEKTLIQSILQPVLKDYDFVILDCAPGYNLITRSALLSSNFYLMPAKPEPLSLIGIQLLERRIAKLREAHKSETPLSLELLGITFLLSGSLMSGRYYSQVMRRLNDDFSEAKLFKTRIPVDVNVARAVDNFMPVVLSQPGSAGAKAFASLAQEFLQKLAVAAKIDQPPTKLVFAD
jgi:cellulose biosynthesis protein BcsQ